MVQVTPQYPQVTPEQVDLWVANPVTQAYLTSLNLFRADVIDDASNGNIVNSSCADMTHAMVHLNMGQQQGISTAIDYNYLFDRCGLILTVDKEEKTDD